MKQSYQLEKEHIVVLFDRGVKNKSNNRGGEKSTRQVTTFFVTVG
jgi:hypothetical protein